MTNHNKRHTRSGGAEGRATKLVVQGLREGEVTPVRERRLHQTVGNTEILPSVRERSIRDANSEPLQGIIDAPVEVEAHLVQPGKSTVI